MFLVRGGRAVFFVSYYFLLHACFLYTLLPSPRDTLQLLGQILIKRDIRYCLNTSLFNFDTHKGLTVKIYIILVCTQQEWALDIFDVIRTPSLMLKNVEKVIKKTEEAPRKIKRAGTRNKCFFFSWPNLRDLSSLSRND